MASSPSSEFKLEILSPGKELFCGEVTEVLLPADDGEVGVLPRHKNFVGLLGTGVLKLVKGGDDYWFMVSAGVFEVRGGSVTILAEVAETAEAVDVEAAKQQQQELEPQFSEKSFSDPDFEEFFVSYERAKARIEVHRRTHTVH